MLEEIVLKVAAETVLKSFRRFFPGYRIRELQLFSHLNFYRIFRRKICFYDSIAIESQRYTSMSKNMLQSWKVEVNTLLEYVLLY